MIEEPSRVRRVVTGHDRDGRAIVLWDGLASNITERPGGIMSTLLWTIPESPATHTVVDRGATNTTVMPPRTGVFFRFVEFPPSVEGAADSNALFTTSHATNTVRRPPRHPAMHATETVDYAIVLEGEIDMLLDDSEVHLMPGDILIQQATNHAWVNRGRQPCKMAVVIIDAGGSPLVPMD